jgi:hypothetical protein
MHSLFKEYVKMKLSHTDTDLKELGNRIKAGFEGTLKGKKDDSCKDLIAVAVSASLLQVSEFKCFQVAYEQWFGHELDEQSMENIFSSYLMELTVPHWVRHFTRKVFYLEVQGNLNPEEFNIVRPKNTRKDRIRGICYSVLMLAITVIFCIMIVS